MLHNSYRNLFVCINILFFSEWFEKLCIGISLIVTLMCQYTPGIIFIAEIKLESAGYWYRLQFLANEWTK